MNFYAKRYIGYNEDYTQSSDKLFSIIEGVYETNFVQKARVVGHLNLTNGTFHKFVKQPYTVTDITEHAITLKKHGHNFETNTLFKTETYFSLENLLLNEGVLQQRTEQIIANISRISLNSSIKASKHCYEGDWHSL